MELGEFFIRVAWCWALRSGVGWGAEGSLRGAPTADEGAVWGGRNRLGRLCFISTNPKRLRWLVASAAAAAGGPIRRAFDPVAERQ